MSASAKALADHGLKRQAVTQRLLASVFEGRFEPQSRLRVEHLAEELGVSVTPIREALVELAGIGIVELQPNRGAVLRPFGPQQLREICHLRRVLESEAARSACGRIAPMELRALAAELRRLAAAPRSPQWSADTRRLDSQLHEMVATHCGNERLAYEISRYRTLFRTLRDVRHQRRQSRADYQQMDENAEHLAIVEALLADRPAEAADAMSRHIDASAEVLERDLFAASRSSAPKR
jgi:DNA-binding GntR family transcriptional regulator